MRTLIDTKGVLFQFFIVMILCLFSCKQTPSDQINKIVLSDGDQKRINTFPEATDTLYVRKLLAQSQQVKRHFPDSAIAMCQEALFISRNLNYTTGIAQSLIEMSSCLSDQKNDYRHSKVILYQAVPYCQGASAQDVILTARVYNALGYIYTFEGRHDSAMYYYALSLGEMQKQKISDTAILTTIYANIGNELLSSNQFSQAKYYIQKSIAYSRQIKDTLTLAKDYGNMGVGYLNSADSSTSFDSGVYNFNVALNLFQQLRDTLNILQALSNIGRSYLKAGKISQAKKFINAAIGINPTYSKKRNDIQETLGFIYYAEGNYLKAVNQFKRALKIGMHNGDKMRSAEINENIAEMFVLLGNSNKAFQYEKTYATIRDSLLNAEKIEIASQLEIKYRVAEKDKLLAQNKLQLSRQHLWMVVVGAIAVLWILILLGILHNRQHKSEINKLRATLQGEEKERRRLARELHDGIIGHLYALKLNFNSFPARHPGMDVDGDYMALAEQIEHSIQEVRTTAHNLLPEILRQEGLEKAIALFCEKLSQLGSITITFQAVGYLPVLGSDFELGVYRIVQEAVNNVIKHSEANHALVQFTAKEDWLSITIDDDGKGIVESSSTGIGLLNLHERVKALQGTLEIESGKGTSIYLEFDLKRHSMGKVV